MIENTKKIFFIVSSLLILLNICGFIYYSKYVLISLIVILPLIILGLYDILQTKKAILRNFPVIGNLRYFLESIRPEIQQYFVESDTDARPIARDLRSIVYQRAKSQMDTRAFGTQLQVYEVGYEWINHSLSAPLNPGQLNRCIVGGPLCQKPYEASLLNISAMSFGALSDKAILALNGGAKLGDFAHNTGEGGISPYHQKKQGDLIWQIGTGYFGCRNSDGTFSAEKFKESSNLEQVKMIEIKLSQGAKPGHGGVLPAIKNTQEIAATRGVKAHTTVLSPPLHSAFQTPIELCNFINKLRELSSGKPIGFKMCIGKRREFLAICKAMHETNIYPDFIAVDGGEGGTGAAPLEFQNRVGSPLRDGLIFVHNSLTGFNLREKIKIVASGKNITAFDIIQRIAIGADACYSARAMMLSLGCIQALKCNTNTCPTGVTTQDPRLKSGLVVADKEHRVNNYHKNTLAEVVSLINAMGLSSTNELRPWHIMKRTGQNEIKNYSEIFEYIEEGSLLSTTPPKGWREALEMSSAASFSIV